MAPAGFRSRLGAKSSLAVTSTVTVRFPALYEQVASSAAATPGSTHPITNTTTPITPLIRASFVVAAS